MEKGLCSSEIGKVTKRFVRRKESYPSKAFAVLLLMH